MAIEFILCRRKDDHEITHPIARQSLRHWPDWEPVPDEGEVPADAEASERPPVRADTASVSETAVVADVTPTSKSRRPAATDSKE